MEESQEDIAGPTKFTSSKSRRPTHSKDKRSNCNTLKELSNSGHNHHHHFHDGYYCWNNTYKTYPSNLLPLLPLPPPVALQPPHLPPPLLPKGNHRTRSKSHQWKDKFSPVQPHLPIFSSVPAAELVVLPPSPPTTYTNSTDVCGKVAAKDPGLRQKELPNSPKSQALVAVRRPDSGGEDGIPIALLANHFRVEFDPSQRIFQYDVDICPRPSKEVARILKQQLVEENPTILSGSLPVFDGRRNLYSPLEFQDNRIELYVNLPLPTSKSAPTGDPNAPGSQRLKLFRVNIKLVSKLSGEDLSTYLLSKEEGEDDGIPLPQDYLQALDVVLRESPTEKCTSLGRSLYSNAMGGAVDIGGGAIGLRGFFQSLRPTQQGLALNVDFSVTAFHESIGIIAYLQKRCDFLRDLGRRKSRSLVGDEKRAVEKALKNIRVFVCHRDTDQRYRVYGLTEESTENLRFRDRNGKELRIVDYYKVHYNHDIEFRNLPCLQISRSKPCYLPMELCIVCDGQKFLGKLTDDQTARILKMGCQRPGERKGIIDGVMGGSASPTCGRYASGFTIHVSREMTRLRGRVLQPPKLKLGDGGNVRDLTPTRQDRQWNLFDSHVAEGTRIGRWALISFGGTVEQRSSIPKFVAQLSHRCEKLGIYLNRTMVVAPIFEHIHVLNNASALEAKLRKIHEAACGNLQLLVCVMEKKHRGYADLKRIAETNVGVVSQCCLYSNITKLGLQFLVNLALKINTKVGGCNVILYNAFSCQIPRLFSDEEPAIFMGADVTHPHPLDDLSPSVAAVVASVNWPSANKYVSRMRSQTHRQEIIQDLEEMAAELLQDFHQGVGKLPARILFFRDGVSETQFYKVLKQELQAIKDACLRFPNYCPKITFAVVQKRHHTRLFPDENGSNCSGRAHDENIPPGTVVDAVITHPREFDFYLCTHWGMKGTSRPTHYHVLWDDNKFRSDELQRLIYNLCYTFAKCTKPVSLVPPAYYAHLAAYRGRLYLDRSDGIANANANANANARNTSSRASPPHATPLPKLRDNLKKLMFYC